MRYLKQTVARILSEVAVREWPQRWPNLLPTLFAACDPAQQGQPPKDPAGAELIALILRNLAEEATSDGSAASSLIPDQRRKDLQAGLMAVMESIFPWVQAKLRGAVQRFASNKADQQALRESLALLETLRALFEFLPAKWVFESQILGELCGMLVQPDLFMEIADLLQSISNRKTSTIDQQYHGQIVAVWDVVLNWMPALQPAAAGADGKAAPASFPRQREFLQKLLLVLNNCTKYHAELLTPPQYDGVKTKLLSTLGQLLNHPFQKVGLVALELWVHLLRNHAASVIKVEYRASLITELLKIACVRLIKMTSDGRRRKHTHACCMWPLVASAPLLLLTPLFVYLSGSDFEDQEMESQEEYNQFFGIWRGALLQLITHLAELDPVLCFQVVIMRYQHLFSLAPATDHLHKQTGFVSMRTSRFLELEATGSLLECLFRSVPKTAWTDAKTGPALMSTNQTMLRALLAWNTEDPLLQTRRLHVLCMFVPILAASPPLFNATLDALLAGVSFRPAVFAQTPWADLPEDLKACRRRGIVSLIQLARKRDTLVIPLFLPHFPALVHRILSMLQAGAIAPTEKIALFEFLVLISLAQSDPAAQKQFLESILAEPLGSWTSSAMNSLLAYGSEVPAGQQSAFLQLLGLNPEDQSILQSSQALPPSHRTASREKRREISHMLHTFMSVFKPMCVAPNNSIVGPTSAGGVAAAAAASASPKSAPSTASEAARVAVTSLIPLIMPNVLRLLGHIYSVRSEAVRAQLPQNMHALLAPSADQLLNPGSAVLATQAQVAPSTYHLLWDVRRWMDKILDSGVNILMLAAKSGESFYTQQLSNPQVARQYIDCLYSNLTVMHVREIRTLIDKFLEVVFNLCPPSAYMAVLMGASAANGAAGAAPTQQTNILPNILRVVHQRLEAAWGGIAAAKANGGKVSNNTISSSSSSSTSLSSEIHEESELRELSRCLSDNFSRTIELQYVALHTALAGAHPPPTSTPNSREEKEREKERRQQESQLLMSAPFCQLIFTQQPLLASLFPLLLFLLSCPDSASSVRAVRLCHRLLPVAIGSRNPAALSYYSSVFDTGVRVLAQAPAQTLEVVEMELIALLKDVYAALVLPGLAEAPRLTLLSLPGATVPAVQALEAVLGTICAEKKYRSAMRAFLDTHIKAARLAQQAASGASGTGAASLTANPLELVSSKAPNLRSVRDLAPLNLPPRPRKPEEDLSGLGQLFD